MIPFIVYVLCLSNIVPEDWVGYHTSSMLIGTGYVLHYRDKC